MKQETKQKLKWSLLGLIPSVLIPTTAVAIIYGTNRPSGGLNNKYEDIDSVLKEEMTQVYEEFPTLKGDPIIEETISSNVKQQIKSEQVPATRQKLKAMLRREFAAAQILLENKIAELIDKALEKYDAKELETLYAIYEAKRYNASLEKVFHATQGVGGDWFDRAWWMWQAKALKPVVTLSEIAHKQQLINMIKELDDWMDYNTQRNEIITGINQRYAVGEYNKYQRDWDIAALLQKEYDSLPFSKQVENWVNFREYTTFLKDEYQFNVKAVQSEIKKLNDWTERARDILRKIDN